MRSLLVLVLFMAAPARAELDSFGLGTGRDGLLNVTALSEFINPAAPLVASAPAGSQVLRLGELGKNGRDTLVLVHQSAGRPAPTPSDKPDTVTPGAVGRWELARVASVSTAPAELRLTAPLVHSYTVPGAQVVVVPEYTRVTIDANASLVAPPWDGRSGGILAFLATGTVMNQGRVSADGAGFRGGVFLNHGSYTGCTGLNLPREQGGSDKGEGLAVERFGLATGRSNLVHGGGGGNCLNSGGGGGGHGGVGGTGGRTASDIDGSRDEGGLGGAWLSYLLVDQALFGGGGGAGHGDNGLGSSGGAGGGLVLVRANTVTGAGRFTANGAWPGFTPGDDGAGGGGAGSSLEYRVAYQPPKTPALLAPANGAVGVSPRPVFQGTAEPGVRVLISVDGVDVLQLVSGPDGQFFGTGQRDPLSAGEHRVTMVAESLGAYSVRSSEVTFNVAVALADGGVLEPPVLVVPADGDFVSTSPLFAGVAPTGVSVGLQLDAMPEITLPVDVFGRFRYQVPADSPLAPGPHFVTLHAHNEAGEEGPFSQTTRFEAVAADAGSEVPDAGSEVPDAGARDAGVGLREAPVVVVPAEGEVVDPTPLFAGVAAPGASVSIEVDGTQVASVVADATGAFRHPVSPEQALSLGAHTVTAHARVSDTGVAGLRSVATDFEVRGPVALDVGCGCGASPAGAAGVGALLVGLVAVGRRRRR